MTKQPVKPRKDPDSLYAVEDICLEVHSLPWYQHRRPGLFASGALAILFATQLANGAQRQPIRISAWYWLNSAPRSEWSRDFHDMARLGFTDVDLCWGLDLSAWTKRQTDTRYALDTAAKAGIKAYFVVWQPSHNTLPRKPAFQQVDAGGHVLFTFDTFNTEWRNTEWKTYLQSVAKLFSRHPAFTGYIFDDTFSMGGIGTIDGPRSKPQERYISYNTFDKKLFGKEPPKSPGQPGWAEWTEARSNWWAAWASDTVKFIREVDPDPQHEIYVEDNIHTIFGSKVRDQVGLDFGKAAQPWDAVGAYTTPTWDGTPESSRKAVDLTRQVLRDTRTAVGPDKAIIYTFWVANFAEFMKPAPAKYPTFEQIRDICEATLAMGVRHLDMYGYRIGDARVTAASWPQRRPPETGPYPLTDPFIKKHLYDRIQVREQLGTYLNSLHGR